MLERITNGTITGSRGIRASKATISRTTKKLSTITNAHRTFLSNISESHDVVAAIDVDSFTRDSRAQIGS